MFEKGLHRALAQTCLIMGALLAIEGAAYITNNPIYFHPVDKALLESEPFYSYIFLVGGVIVSAYSGMLLFDKNSKLNS